MRAISESSEPDLEEDQQKEISGEIRASLVAMEKIGWLIHDLPAVEPLKLLMLFSTGFQLLFV